MEPWQDVVFTAYVVIVAIVASRIPFYEFQVARSPRLRPDDPTVDPENAPLVSILVPAKDEERTIESCVRSLLAQNYPRFEILVVDDRSEDRTAEIVASVAAEDDRVRLVRIEELPPGWTGKTHALQCGQEHAKGEWLLFVDADVTLHENCVGVVLRDAIDHGADMETLVLGMDAASLWEGVVQPYAGTQLLMLYPPARINRPDHPGWGNGQFILVRRETYDAIGRHEAVRDKFVEDIHLGRAVRAKGHNLRVGMASRVSTVRMYSSLSQILRGWARIFYSAVDFRTKPLWLLIVATIVFSLLSYVVIAAAGVAWLAGARGPFVSRMLLLGVIHEALQLVLYWRIYVETRTPLRYLPLRVLGVWAMLAIHLRAIRMCRTHEVEWRGTTYGRDIQAEG